MATDLLGLIDGTFSANICEPTLFDFRVPRMIDYAAVAELAYAPALGAGG